MKKCCKCGVEKPRTEFHQRPERGPNSVRSACKLCSLSVRKAARTSAEAMEKERALEVARKWKRDNAERNKEKQAAWNLANPDKTAEYARKSSVKFRFNNRELVVARSLASRAKKPDYYKEARALWQKENPGKCRAKYKAYMAQKKSAMPAWSDPELMEMIYDHAQFCTKFFGVPYHVDHIVPLQSPRVCGLHVQDNLRVIPAVINIKKSNRHWPDMP